TSTEREDIVEADIPIARNARGLHVYSPDGKEAPSQRIDGPEHSLGRIAFLAKTPPVGFASYTVDLASEGSAPGSSLKVSDRQLENERYTVKLNDAGDVASIFDKQNKRE